MNRKPFVIFGLVVALFAVLIPLWAFDSDGDPESRSGELSASQEQAKQLFDVNCGTCHALYAAGTDGNFGPNLDDLLAPSGPPTGETAADTIKATKSRVVSAIVNGVDGTTEPGRMPGGILGEEQAQQVAGFVAQTAGQG